MIQQTIFSNGQGAGVLADTYEEFASTLASDSFALGGTTVKPDDEYEFTGLLSRELKYVGNIGKKMFFYLGEDNGKHYFKEINVIDESLIYISYKAQSGNSHEFKNGAWYRPGAKHRKKLQEQAIASLS